MLQVTFECDFASVIDYNGVNGKDNFYPEQEECSLRLRLRRIL